MPVRYRYLGPDRREIDIPFSHPRCSILWEPYHIMLHLLVYVPNLQNIGRLAV